MVRRVHAGTSAAGASFVAAASVHRGSVSAGAMTLLLFVAMLGAVSAPATRAEQTARRPNLVLMIVDELGTGDVPWADSTIHAPKLLELAESGLRLGTQYAWQWCAPTRGALMSGRFPMHTGYAGGGMPGDGEGMDLRIPLLPGELKAASYATHMIGKVRPAV